MDKLSRANARRRQQNRSCQTRRQLPQAQQLQTICQHWPSDQPSNKLVQVVQVVPQQVQYIIRSLDLRWRPARVHLHSTIMETRPCLHCICFHQRRLYVALQALPNTTYLMNSHSDMTFKQISTLKNRHHLIQSHKCEFMKNLKRRPMKGKPNLRHSKNWLHNTHNKWKMTWAQRKKLGSAIEATWKTLRHSRKR